MKNNNRVNLLIQAQPIKSRGFTIIELMIATTIFSFILLIATTGIVRIGQMYYKGVTESRTQEVTRQISDELARAVQFSDNEKTVVFTNDRFIKRFCFGDTRYTANLDKKVTDVGVTDGEGLIAERLSLGADCACSGACVQETKQLLGQNMRLLKFRVGLVGSGVSAWYVDLKVAYGDNDLLNHYNDQGVLIGGTLETQEQRMNDAMCKSGISASSFCAVAQLDTVVKKRLN